MRTKWNHAFGIISDIWNLPPPSHRSGRRIRKTRKYDIITTPAERVEMAPLNEENDDEDDSTLFDVKYRFEASKWRHQTDLIFTFVPSNSCSIDLWSCSSPCAVDIRLHPSALFHCLLTHKHFLKERQCPVYLHSDMFPGALSSNCPFLSQVNST